MTDTNGKNPLLRLLDEGQSIWLDSIRRRQIRSGELEKLIDEDGLRGETANPTIFEKAISGSSDYDEQISQLADQGLDANAIYERVATDDVRMACDVFRPLYDQLDGTDGFVSLEVSPKLAYNTQGTIEEVRRFWKIVDRPNLMIKIPGTKEGVPAIEQALYEGMNINITLLFAVEAYEAVAWAYVRALERRVAEGKPIDRLASVASFFVSRIDTLADKLIDDRLKNDQVPQTPRTAGGQEYGALNSLKGKLAIANAKIAYERFKKIFTDPRFQALQAKGAKVQRPLWASTSTKNPAYSDVMYVEELIGPDTVNTLPLETLLAFKDHGHVERTVDKDVDQARAQIQKFESLGLSLQAVTDQVLKEGVDKFDQSLDQLLQVIDQKRTAIKQGVSPRASAALGGDGKGVAQRLEEVKKNDLAQRLWQYDASLWTQNPEHQAKIRNRLGWLTVATAMKQQIRALQDFTDEVIADGFKHVLLLGMGGSSLAPEVMQYTFGIAPGHPNLAVLDTSDPATIHEYLRELNPHDTLYLVSSKSGATLETLSFYRYYYEHVCEAKGDKAGASFVAITDPGTPLEKLAKERGFRRIFANPADIGGRYSALSYFGLVPAALMGVDLGKLLDRAAGMMRACEVGVPAEHNPGLGLGMTLGELYSQGRDKITFVLSPQVQKFGSWLEQLLAESTGKASETTGQGEGLVPVDGETLGPPEVYGDDRVFIYLRLDGDENDGLDKGVAALEQAGQPVVRLSLSDPYALGGEFFRWEFATAVASALMGINAFDEPNVAESKENTQRVLDEYKEACKLPESNPIFSQNGILLYWNQAHGQHERLEDYVREFLDQTRPHDYIALMAYLTHSPASDHAFATSRVELRARYHTATTLGYGPRFLHSTGQLHKGGTNEGVFIQITGTDLKDASIPGEEYTFGVLKEAQALGDLQALHDHQRRVIRLHLAEGTDVADLAHLIDAAVGSPAVPSEHPDGIVSASPDLKVQGDGSGVARKTARVKKPTRGTSSKKKRSAARKTSTMGRRKRT
jgi:transaldolase / glucose-6-phosphate isomerase